MDIRAVEEWLWDRQRELAIAAAFVAAAIVGLVMVALLGGGSGPVSNTASVAGPEQTTTTSAAVGVVADPSTTEPPAPADLVVTIDPSSSSSAPTTEGSTSTTDTTASSTASSSSSTTTTTTTTTEPPATTTTSTTAANPTSASPTSASPTSANPTSVTTAPTTTTARPTTTTRPPTTTTANRSNAATYHGVKPFNSFFQGTLQYDAWTAGDVAFYAPQGQVSRADGERWVEWYRRVDELYRQMSTKDNFESVYRRDDPNFGRVKVLGIVETCGAGCGSKQQAEADPGYLPRMVAEPNNPDAHWIFFYEMGRVGSASSFEDFYGRATWPTNTLIVPHMMAAVAYYDLGGESLLRNGNTKFLFEELDRWEAENIEYVDQFPIPNQQTQNGYTSHHLMPAMLLTIATETSLDTLWQILENMSNEPEATSATQAMCDFQDAVNAATGGRYAARMTGEWGLPDTCP